MDPAVEKVVRENAEALRDPESYWRAAADELDWFERTGPVFEPLDGPPFGRWFAGWSTNLAANAVDRAIAKGHGERVAYYWEGENGDRRTIRYRDLDLDVRRWAAQLRSLGVGRDDRVTIYLPMIPELPAAMLACARLGAVHSVVFAGFAEPALVERIRDSASGVVVTADGGYRRGRVVPLKAVVDAAVPKCPSVRHVLLARRTGEVVPMEDGRDVPYDPAGPAPEIPPVPRRGADPTFILYTSGTTGRPKGVTHGTGGYMVWVHRTMQRVFGVRPSDVFWCAADIGWVTGHSYIVYGPLLVGATSMLYEGTPDQPTPARWWELVERYKISILYTSPTAIRMHMRFGEKWPRQHDLGSLRLLGSVGEAINPEAWRWYRSHIGGGRLPIVDTWWQTETGAAMVSPQAGGALVPLEPGSATLPLPGVDLKVVHPDGTPAPVGERGLVVVDRPWPGQFLGLWNDEARFRSAYFERFPGRYSAGDYARIDASGYLWFLGRADEVLKVAGHRLGTIELENALITNPAVAESAVVGVPDDLRGEVPYAVVILRPGFAPSLALERELKRAVHDAIGGLAEPREVRFVQHLPKTRSGKIMRRVIAAVIRGTDVGDVSTLEDGATVEEVRDAVTSLRAEL
ncbi:MAG TPA: acetate--CoA ligase [Thermoplasmata archaeon]|nr:acetate--CoA ligase [Thermoplasmata archaeon]